MSTNDNVAIRIGNLQREIAKTDERLGIQFDSKHCLSIITYQKETKESAETLML